MLGFCCLSTTIICILVIMVPFILKTNDKTVILFEGCGYLRTCLRDKSEDQPRDKEAWRILFGSFGSSHSPLSSLYLATDLRILFYYMIVLASCDSIITLPQRMWSQHFYFTSSFWTRKCPVCSAVRACW